MKIILTTVLTLLTAAASHAHYLWIETAPVGAVQKAQEIRIYYGEYTYGMVEKVNGESFPKVRNFSLWVLDEKGAKTELQTTARDSFYVASFTPQSEGTYTVILNNNKIDVIDYTQYDFGIFKTHYHSTARIQVGKETGNMQSQNPDGLSLVRLPDENESAVFRVLYKGKPLVKNEVAVFVTDLWSKTIYTDEEGLISFKLPWNEKYILEVTSKEEVPGTYNGRDYEFIWHCATYCIPQ